MICTKCAGCSKRRAAVPFLSEDWRGDSYQVTSDVDDQGVVAGAPHEDGMQMVGLWEAGQGGTDCPRRRMSCSGEGEPFRRTTSELGGCAFVKVPDTWNAAIVRPVGQTAATCPGPPPPAKHFLSRMRARSWPLRMLQLGLSNRAYFSGLSIHNHGPLHASSALSGLTEY